METALFRQPMAQYVVKYDRLLTVDEGHNECESQNDTSISANPIPANASEVKTEGRKDVSSPNVFRSYLLPHMWNISYSRLCIVEVKSS